MLCEETAKNDVIRALLLVCSNGEEAATLLVSHLFNRTNIVERMEILTSTEEEFAEVTATLEVQIFHQVHDLLARFVSLHKDALLGVLNELGTFILQNLSSLVRLSLILEDSKRVSFDTKL